MPKDNYQFRTCEHFDEIDARYDAKRNTVVCNISCPYNNRTSIGECSTQGLVSKAQDKDFFKKLTINEVIQR